MHRNFPESFSRTTDTDPFSDVSLDAMDVADHSSPSPPPRLSRRSVMKLENILNDVSIAFYSRSQSVCDSPEQPDTPLDSVRSFFFLKRRLNFLCC